MRGLCGSGLGGKQALGAGETLEVPIMAVQRAAAGWGDLPMVSAKLFRATAMALA